MESAIDRTNQLRRRGKTAQEISDAINRPEDHADRTLRLIHGGRDLGGDSP